MDFSNKTSSPPPSSSPETHPRIHPFFTNVESCGSNNITCRKRKRGTRTKMSRKGKEACNTSSDPKSRTDDAWWDMPQVSLLIELMYEHFKKGHLLSSTFSEQIWREIGNELSQRNKTQYIVAQLKGKANRFRMLWRKFYDLVYKRTGFGWDPTTCTVTASEDRWAEWIAANPRESGLKKKGLPHFDLCTEMFSSSVATGSHARSSAMPPVSNNDNDDVDVSYPTMATGNPLESGPEQIPTARRGRQRKGEQSDRLKRVDKCIDAITACSEVKTQKLTNVMNDNIGECHRAGVMSTSLNNRQAHSPKELFNQRHSQLRNVIERAFDVLKNRFPILKGPMPPYSLDRQRDLVIACCVIHNFIRKFGIDDQFFEHGERGEFDDLDNEANDQYRRLPQQSQQDIDTQAAFRDAMAGHLWSDRDTGNDNTD
ncbi:uncharacterized protein LOC105180135 isoform X1 [Sesamum indicum]|uniref:Uncharacterized protein LOC105180135 isoform X1 n=2 Tax=Sesamum indicum TaxID=4182 RepID=A0A6I9UJJ9_SESIN|nr:uncharacterized protein LOC105180135 isoform X1 [Sesamum indicum]